MSNRNSEPGLSFVVFQKDKGKDMHFVTMHDDESPPRTLDSSLKQTHGRKAKMIAALRGLTREEVATLVTIFSGVGGLRVERDDDLRALLRLRPVTTEVTEVRKAVIRLLPEHVNVGAEDDEYLAAITWLFELYVRSGGNPDAFEKSAEEALVSDPRRANFIVIFHTALHELLPKIQKRMAEEN